MATNAIQGSRFEQKYIVTEEVALQIRDFVRSHLELDENAVGKPNYSYAVDSVYLDSRDLRLFWATLNNDANRFKMRLRFYDGNPEAPVFFELKERTKAKRRTKRRAAVHCDSRETLLAGQSPQESDLAPGHRNDMAVLREFCERMQELDARPLIHVAYFREAYVSPDNLARLTMDRLVRADAHRTAALSTLPLNATMIWGNDVVLELKFPSQCPTYFADLVRTFGLRQCGASKYVDSVATIGEHNLPPPR